MLSSQALGSKWSVCVELNDLLGKSTLIKVLHTRLVITYRLVGSWLNMSIKNSINLSQYRTQESSICPLSDSFNTESSPAS